jgi:hypothetical protein
MIKVPSVLWDQCNTLFRPDVFCDCRSKLKVLRISVELLMERVQIYIASIHLQHLTASKVIQSQTRSDSIR